MKVLQKRSVLLKLYVYPWDKELFVANCPAAQLSPWLRDILISEVTRLSNNDFKRQRHKLNVVSKITKDDAIFIGQLTSAIVFLRVLITSKGNDSDKYRRLSLFLDALDNKINAWLHTNDN